MGCHAPGRYGGLCRAHPGHVANKAVTRRAGSDECACVEAGNGKLSWVTTDGTPVIGSILTSICESPAVMAMWSRLHLEQSHTTNSQTSQRRQLLQHGIRCCLKCFISLLGFYVLATSEIIPEDILLDEAF